MSALLLVLLGVIAWQSLAWRTDQQLARAAAEASAAAAAEVEGLINISGQTSTGDVDALLDGATAEFRTELADQAERLRETLAKNKVAAEGRVVSTGVVSVSHDDATVIVAATGTVKNKQAATPEPRTYRLRVSLSRDGSHWLVSGLEFVG